MKTSLISKIVSSAIIFCILYVTPRLQKISAHSVQPFGRLYATYIYVLFYYIDIKKNQLKNILMRIKKKAENYGSIFW